MQFTDTVLPGVVLVAPTIHRDHRGYFFESYRSKDFTAKLGKNVEFVQGNFSNSVPWAIRGLHYQVKDPQGKLVRCLRGAIYDVAVDMRPKSPTFKRWVGVWLNDMNHQALWVPPGFAHGFMSGPHGAAVSYECSTVYQAAWDRGVRWNDPDLGIDWPLKPDPFSNPRDPVLSGKDASAPLLKDAELPL